MKCGPITLFFVVLVGMGIVIMMSGIFTPLFIQSVKSEPLPRLNILAAVSLRPYVEEVADEFERTHGIIIVERHYGASEDLMTRIQFQPEHETADIYLPADDSYIEKARQKGWVKNTVPLATMKAVVMLGEGENKIQDWPTLLEHRISLANENAAIGQLTREHLKKTGDWAKLEPKLVGVLNVAEAANAVKIGVLPAAIVWEPVAKNYPNLRRLELPELKGIEAKIVAAGLTKKTLTQKFLDALVSPEHGLPTLKKHHFTPIEQR